MLAFAFMLIAAEPKIALQFPAGQVHTVNIVEWQGKDFPVRNPRTGQPPLTNADLIDLSRAEMEPGQIVDMLEERGCACDVSARALVKLKKAGVDKQVVSAASLHALAPNKQIDIDVTIDVGVRDGVLLDKFLYFFADDAEHTRAFIVPIADLWTERVATQRIVDRSDALLEKVVHRARFRGRIPIKNAGTHTLLVAVSKKPSLAHPSQLAPEELDAAKIHTFEYPVASVRRDCRLGVSMDRDIALPEKLYLRGTSFECEWE